MVSARYAAPSWRWMLGGLAFSGLSAWSSIVHAVEPSIWYRTGDGCPDGASFLERLGRQSVSARLAAVGDHVDFVVTLGSTDAGSSGRLERQTSGGTIAIREVQAPSCEAVADALALTLALTLDPASQNLTEKAPSSEDASSREEAPPAPPPPPTTTAAAADDAATVQGHNTRLPGRTSLPNAPPPSAGISTLSEPDARSIDAAEEKLVVRLGAAVAAWDLFEGPWLLQAGPFGELEAPRSFSVPRATLRVALQGGLRPDADASARVWLAAGRVEACPLAVGPRTSSLHPCVASDFGVIDASAGGVNDTAFWSAVAAHVRFRFERGLLALEAQLGGIVPLTRYEIQAASTQVSLEKTSAIGFAGGVGVSVRVE
ncbi:MAG TPA: hypothetical protein VFU02_08310 [Polyangiaceae bacterium]|nr:hypothetical protein [Polyangiaceae bacterium]